MNQTGEMVVCPLCSELEAANWASENGWTAVKCSNCGLVYVNPRPSFSEIAKSNECGQHQTDKGTLDVVFYRDEHKLVFYEKIIRRLYVDLLTNNDPIRWLDVGAGFGEIIEVLRKILPNNSIVHGIEPMRAKAQVARERGVSILPKTLSEVDEKYQVISLINVFSHLPNPRSFLGDVVNRLSPGGEILIETGNGGDLKSARHYPGPLYLPDHLQFAGECHLERFLSDVGLQVVSKQRMRTDTARLAIHCIMQKFRGQRTRIRVPYTSSFRTVFYRARACSHDR